MKFNLTAPENAKTVQMVLTDLIDVQMQILEQLKEINGKLPTNHNEEIKGNFPVDN